MRILRINMIIFLVYHDTKLHIIMILLSNIAKSTNSNCNKFLLEGLSVHFKGMHH